MKLSFPVSLLALAMTFLFATPKGIAETTVYTTYVTKVQEERKSTRWTLTEWLKIKERMKMMDVWLAMFSNPKQDGFSPELYLHYGVMRGDLTLTDSLGNEESGALDGTQARAQLWLTNIITASTGLRTLNIDFGIEGFGRQSEGFSASQTGSPAVGAAASAPSQNPAAVSTLNTSRSLTTSYGTGNLRIFGKNIQDTSLVLKYGQFTSENAIPFWDSQEDKQEYSGTVAGADLNIYLLSFLGIEGNYMQYGSDTTLEGEQGFKGAYYDYSAFIEISLLRLSVGNYSEDWEYSNQGNTLESSETGFLGAAKLQF